MTHKLTTALQALSVITDILSNPTELRGVINYHGEQEGQTMLIDFSNSGEPYTDGRVCFWSKQRDIIDPDGHFHGTDELEYGSFKTYVNAIAHIIGEVENTSNEFHAESY